MGMEGATLLQHTIHKGCFTMIYVGNNGNISKIVFSQNYILFIYLIKLRVGNLPFYRFIVENKSEIIGQRLAVNSEFSIYINLIIQIEITNTDNGFQYPWNVF